MTGECTVPWLLGVAFTFWRKQLNATDFPMLKQSHDHNFTAKHKCPNFDNTRLNNKYLHIVHQEANLISLPKTKLILS